jgi:NADPH-dependent 2,4-dienoyl-CoA reductase/sulfur reductase-like enzyme
MATYLIIGDGAAGMAAAQALRAGDAEATITVLSDEPNPHYYRAALTNYLLGQLRAFSVACSASTRPGTT